MNDKLFTVDHDPKCWGCTNGYYVPFGDTGIQRNHLSGPSPDNKWPTRGHSTREWSRIHFSLSHVSAILCLG